MFLSTNWKILPQIVEVFIFSSAGVVWRNYSKIAAGAASECTINDWWLLTDEQIVIKHYRSYNLHVPNIVLLNCSENEYYRYSSNHRY